ncbi:MAG: TetR/AcrR family transcriptional regulator [Myxococcales bacterium]|nr:TetR/AcrR family transcriptional regulator [Myxococcales bacterium]
MPRPPADERRATAERLLSAAAELFARHGLHATRLADIAARVGIRRPSLLYHYRTKEELYAAVVDRAFSRLGEALAQAMTRGATFRGRFDDVLVAFTTFIDEHAELARIVLRELLAGDRPGRAIVVDRVAPILDLVERFIRIEGRGVIRPELPVRAALLQVASSIVLRAASGELAGPLWGDEDHAAALARTLFFPTETDDPSPTNPPSEEPSHGSA